MQFARGGVRGGPNARAVTQMANDSRVRDALGPLAGCQFQPICAGINLEYYFSRVDIAGFGLSLRAIESRMGRLSLRDYHGLYEHMPLLAGFFLLSGLASAGFPGTIGFIAIDLLFDGVNQIYPYVGVAVVIATALNGTSVLKVYFRLFTGKRHVASNSLGPRWTERVALLALAAMMLIAGLAPQPFLLSRFRAANELLEIRSSNQAATKLLPGPIQSAN